MSSLKRSQKLCPKCGQKNFIRQFFCKFCNFEFPKRDKSQVHNSSIEQFFYKMPNKVINEEKNKNKDEQNNMQTIKLDENEDKKTREVKVYLEGKKKMKIKMINY